MEDLAQLQQLLLVQVRHQTLNHLRRRNLPRTLRRPTKLKLLLLRRRYLRLRQTLGTPRTRPLKGRVRWLAELPNEVHNKLTNEQVPNVQEPQNGSHVGPRPSKT